MLLVIMGMWETTKEPKPCSHDRGSVKKKTNPAHSEEIWIWGSSIVLLV